MFDPRLWSLSVSACRYTCDGCVAHNVATKGSEKKRPTSFHAWDPACLKRLPEYVSKEFHFILTRLSGIDSRLIDVPADGVVCGRGFATIAKRAQTVSLVFNGPTGQFVVVCCSIFCRYRQERRTTLAQTAPC